MERRVQDNPERRRYELCLGERLVGWIDYFRSDGVVSMTHAEVERELRSQGLGEGMVHDALEDAAAACDRSARSSRRRSGGTRGTPTSLARLEDR